MSNRLPCASRATVRRRVRRVRGLCTPRALRRPDPTTPPPSPPPRCSTRRPPAKLVLTGPDAPMFLGNLSTNDIKNLPLGGGCEAYFCDSRAKVQFAAWIYHVRLGDGRHALWVETTPGRNAELAEVPRPLPHLRAGRDRRRDRRLRPVPPRRATAAKRAGEGPRRRGAGPARVRTHGADVRGERDVQRPPPRPARGAGVRHRVPARSGPTASGGCSTAAGATPAGPETFETLRIEAGTPVFGTDIDENRFVMEVGRGPGGELHEGLLPRPGADRHGPRPGRARQPRRSSG